MKFLQLAKSLLGQHTATASPQNEHSHAIPTHITISDLTNNWNTLALIAASKITATPSQRHDVLRTLTRGKEISAHPLAGLTTDECNRIALSLAPASNPAFTPT